MILNRLSFKSFFLITISALLMLQSCKEQKSDTTILVDASEVVNEITPWLYGACIEDVNHEIYGGLYDQKIFGESFEEPIPSPQIAGFSIYEGVWKSKHEEISVGSYPGAKLVYDGKEIKKGSVEAEIRFEGTGGNNAGLLICVSEPGEGADNFFGYEISLSSDGSKIVIGKHKNNFEHIKDIPVKCNPCEWNNLKAVVNKNKIEILLNNKSIYSFDNNDSSLEQGKIALRTWHSKVEFRNLKISDEKESETLVFNPLPIYHVSKQWDAIQQGDIKFVFRLDSIKAFNGKNAQMIELMVGEGIAGVSNSGLNRWGIAVRKGQKFEGRLYLKSPNLKGSVTIALQSADGKTEYARKEISGLTSNWQKYPFELTSDNDDKNARFAIYINEPGRIWIDQVTLMSTGNDQFKGLPYRNDIGQAMVDQGLTFLRYGGTMINAPEYRFKKMIGDPDKRPPYKGHWYRYSTNGFGIEDFLKFCEAAGFTPSFAINIEESPEDMADMIEYLNGAATTKWGKIRAENGHPQPYNIKYIGIGNEEVLFNGDRSDEYCHYIERFNLLYDAMKAKDPSVSFINTAWWRPDSPNMEKVFKALDGKAEYWDYHPWADQLTSGEEVEKELRKMQKLFLKWNPNTTMKCAIFEENGNLHNIQRVLGHVTLQNAVRRMGDFVLTSCAANALQPYKQNDNGWDQGQIFFTPSQVWGMPPYYAQQMASRNHQPLLVKSSVENNSSKLDVTATRSEDGNQLILHVANTNEKPITVNLQINGFDKITNAKSITLSGNLNDANTPEEPERIIPIEKEIKKADNQTYEIQPYSYTIFVYSK